MGGALLGVCCLFFGTVSVSDAQRLSIDPSLIPSEDEQAKERDPFDELLNEPVYEDETLRKYYRTRSVVPHRYKRVALRANELVSAGQLDQGGRYYQKILDEYPDSLFALSNLAVVQFRRGQFRQAILLLEKALVNAPDDAFVHSTLGICHFELGELDLAVKALNQSITLDPGDARTRNFMAIVSSEKGWWGAAEKECLRAIELDPEYSGGYYNLANVYAYRPTPDVSLAREYYKKALKAGHPPNEEIEKKINYSAK